MVPIGSGSLPGLLRLLRHILLGVPGAVVVVVITVGRTAAAVVMG